MPQHNVAQLFWRKLLSLGSKYNALIRSVNETCSANTGRFPSGVQDLINGCAEFHQPVRTDLDLKLADFPAKDHDLRDTGHSQQARPQRPICESPYFHQRSRIRSETHLKYIAGRRSEGCHRWWSHTLRNSRGHFDQAFADHLTRLKHICAFAEHRSNDGKPLNRLRTDRFKTRNAIDGRLDRTCDELLDLLGRQAGGFGLNDNLRRGKFRKDVELRSRCRVNAKAEHHGTERNDDSAEPKRKINKPPEHFLSLLFGFFTDLNLRLLLFRKQ